MNIEQIKHERKRRYADLAWWTDHKERISPNDEGGMVGVCDLQIKFALEIIERLNARLNELTEEADREALKNFPVNGEEFDYGFHDQTDF